MTEKEERLSTREAAGALGVPVEALRNVPRTVDLKRVTDYSEVGRGGAASWDPVFVRTVAVLRQCGIPLVPACRAALRGKLNPDGSVALRPGRIMEGAR